MNGCLADRPRKPSTKACGTRWPTAEYRLSYEVYGSGDRVLVWLHGLLLDANLSRGLARRLAAQGNRVVLLDLLGHGRSDKPRHAGAHRMDLYAEQVLCLLDELGVDQVVLGGVSLGTNVSLLTTVQAPERVRGLVLEMPVLEWAAPAAALVFLPLLLEVHYARAPLRLVSWVAVTPATFAGSARSTRSSVPPRRIRTRSPPCCTASWWGPSPRPSTSAGPSPRQRWSWDTGST